MQLQSLESTRTTFNEAAASDGAALAIFPCRRGLGGMPAFEAAAIMRRGRYHSQQGAHGLARRRLPKHHAGRVSLYVYYMVNRFTKR